MRLKSHKVALKKRLRHPGYAAEYLANVLAHKDNAAFLIALRDVIKVSGGLGEFASQAGFNRVVLYNTLSKQGNPTLSTLQEILRPLGLRISVALDEDS